MADTRQMSLAGLKRPMHGSAYSEGPARCGSEASPQVASDPADRSRGNLPSGLKFLAAADRCSRMSFVDLAPSSPLMMAELLAVSAKNRTTPASVELAVDKPNEPKVRQVDFETGTGTSVDLYL